MCIFAIYIFVDSALTLITFLWGIEKISWYNLRYNFQYFILQFVCNLKAKAANVFYVGSEYVLTDLYSTSHRQSHQNF